MKDVSEDRFKIHQGWEDGPSGGKQVHGAGNRTDCLGNGDGVRNQVRSLRCEEWQRNQKKWSGVNLSFFISNFVDLILFFLLSLAKGLSILFIF